MTGTRVFWAVVALFVLFFIINSPDDAANIGHSIGHGVQHGFNQLSEFVKKL